MRQMFKLSLATGVAEQKRWIEPYVWGEFDL